MKLITHENSSDTVILAEEFDMLEPKGALQTYFPCIKKDDSQN